MMNWRLIKTIFFALSVTNALAAPVIDEQLETNPGYDYGSGDPGDWVEDDPGTGYTLDPDQATSGITGAPSDWDDEALEMIRSGGSSGVLGINDLALSQITGVAYVRLELIVSSHGDANFIFQLENNIAQPAMKLRTFNQSGNFKLRLECYHDGSSNTYDTSVLNDDQRYRIEMMWDITGDSWEWRIDGTTEDSGSLTSTHVTNVARIRFGGYKYNNETLYMDNLMLTEDGWPGAAAAAAPNVTPIFFHMINQ